MPAVLVRKSVVEPDQAIDNQFGKWVRENRERVGIPERQAAENGGLTPKRWIAIERGARVRAATATEARGIAKALGTDYATVIRAALGEA